MKTEESQLLACIDEEMVDTVLGDQDHSTNSKRKTNVKLFTCGVCGESYARKIKMTQCQVSHSGEQVPVQQAKPSEKYTCDLCGKELSTKNILQRHMIDIHSEVKPFTCDVCCKGFARLPMLEEHKLAHSELKQFVCTDCGNSFRRKSVLKRHQLQYCK